MRSVSLSVFREPASPFSSCHPLVGNRGNGRVACFPVLARIQNGKGVTAKPPQLSGTFDTLPYPCCRFADERAHYLHTAADDVTLG